MRALAITAMLVATNAYAKPANQTFLGIGMQDLPRGMPGCQVTLVTPGSGAEEAKLETYDVLTAIDGRAMSSCSDVLTAVTGHDAGDWISLGVSRRTHKLTVKAQLLTRDEVLRRRLVGKSLANASIVALDESFAERSIVATNNAAIVAWLDPARCDGCDATIQRVSAWARGRVKKRGAPIDAYAVARRAERGDPAQVIADLRSLQKRLDAPLYVADEALFAELAIDGTDRVQFLVLDCRGVVQHVASLSPTSDDASAILDDLFAAAELAARPQ